MNEVLIRHKVHPLHTGDIKIAVERGELFPANHSPLDSGWDLRAKLEHMLVIPSGSKAMIPTGIRLEIPVGFEAQVRPRSSLSKRSIHCYFGTIDASYRGEVMVVLHALGEDVEIQPLEKIAQLVFAPIMIPNIQIVGPEELTETHRGEGGFGSTGRF